MSDYDESYETGDTLCPNLYVDGRQVLLDYDGRRTALTGDAVDALNLSRSMGHIKAKVYVRGRHPEQGAMYFDLTHEQGRALSRLLTGSVPAWLQEDDDE